MSDSAENWTVRIVIEALDPPSGHGFLEGQEPWNFTGWLELIEKVEEIRLRRDPAFAGAPMHPRRLG